MGKITNALLASLLAGSVNVAAQAPAQTKPVELGYNALEVLGTTQGDARVRGLTNVDFSLGEIKPGFHGLNELTFKQGERTLDTYFGRNVLTLGIGDSKIVPAAVLKIDKTGVFDAKYGIRNTTLPEALGGYGFLDIVFNKDGANATAFYGKEAGRFTIEALESLETPYKGRRAFYSEIQPYLKLGRGYSLTARAEVDGKDFRKGRYLFGGVKKF